MYLYGASVQGIQGFIFETNKLQEIVGASEIVKSVASEFEKYNPTKILVNAAGNIKAVFDTKEACEKVVLEFSKLIQKKAYRITISQAVVKFDGEVKNYYNELEKRLKVQRNKPTIPLDLSINILKLHPSTAKPKVSNDGDMAIKQKLKANQDFYKNHPSVKEFKNFSYMKNNKGKIAIVHIDGNGLGQLIPKLTIPLSEFSLKLDSATKKALADAKSDSMHIREVIVGGDDVTVICNANDALEFTKNFLSHFEKETKIIGGLTACAGIAYCNEKYPFHYAVDLAEALCGVTKKHAKAINPDLAPSSLMFHNIQSSNYESWDTFVKDELTIRNDKQTIRCDFGPYYLDQPTQPLIQNLQNSVEAYRCEGSPIGRLRNWMSELYKSQDSSKSMLERINDVTEQSGKWKCEIMDKNLETLYGGLSNDTLIISKDGFDKTPIYNILQILSTTDNKGEK